MDRQYDVLTVLDCCVDLVVSLGSTVPEFGQKEQYVDNYSVEVGGSGCIFASQTAKLGLKTEGVGAVGNDSFGRMLYDAYTQIGLDTHRIRRTDDEKTGLGVLLCKENDRAILTYNGTIDAVTIDDFPDDIFSDVRHLHISSYYLMNGIRPFWKELARKAKAAGVTISLDTNWDPEEKWDPELLELLRYVDIFLPNEQEAQHLSGKKDPLEAARFFAEIVPIVVVKLGEKGALAVSGGDVYRCAAEKVEVVDAVGAGDSFDGGFVYGYLNGYPVQDCLRAGCHCGSMSTLGHGGCNAQINALDMKAFFNKEGA